MIAFLLYKASCTIYFKKDKTISKSKLLDVYKRLWKNTDRNNVLPLPFIVAFEMILLGE